MKEYIVLLVFVVFISCKEKTTNEHYYDNSKTLKKGMNLNQTIKQMKGNPYIIYDTENKYTDKNIRLFFRYWDYNNNTEIYLYFDDSLRLYEINYAD